MKHDHHTDICACGHDHHHEEQECSCGHGHHHHEETRCPYHIHGHMHEGAAVVSGSIILPGGLNCHQDAVCQMLESIAAQVRQSNGIIGHIKASALERKATLISVTKDVASVTPCEEIVLELNITAIVFSVKLDTMERWLHEFLEELERKERGYERL